MENVTLEILPERPAARNDENSEFDIVIEVNSVSSEGALSGERKPQNLCIVIDRSSSMDGEKIETAKASCIDIFRRLKEDDLFTVVVFNNEAEVVINPQTQQELIESKIRGIRTSGMTNLALGWRLGLLELQTYGSSNHVHRLILLSDGHANRGETKPSVLGKQSFQARESGISTSTIGIGENFDENLLEVIATESGGRFWYIKESRIEDIIKEEFQDSLAVVVERPRVELTLPEGVRISKQLNDLRLLSGKYRIAQLTRDQPICFAVRLELDPSRIDGEVVELKSRLYNGDEVLTNTSTQVLLKPLNEYVLTEDNPVVRSVVSEYEASKTDEEMIEVMAGDELDLMQSMIVQEIGGMRVVKDRLEARMRDERDANKLGRMEREREKMQHEMFLKEELGEVVHLMEIAKRLGAMREAADFQRRCEKVLKFYSSSKKGKGRKLRMDRQLQADFLRDAILFAENLTIRFPGNPDIVALLDELNGRLERY